MHVYCLSFYWAPLRRVCLSLLTSLIRYSYTSVRFPQSPLFSWLNSPSSPRLYSQKRCYSSLSISVAFHWLSPLNSWFSCSGELRTGQSSPGVSHQCGAEEKDLLPQPAGNISCSPRCSGARAHCWVVSSLLFTRTPRAFSPNLPSIQSAPTLVNMITLLQVEDSHFVFSNLIALLFAHFSSPCRYTGWIRHSFQFSIIWMLCATLQIINEDIKPYWPQYFPLEHATGDWPPAQHYTTDDNFKQNWKHAL